MVKKEIANGIIISASFIRETPKSWFLDCEGDLVWFPKKHCNYDHDKKELEAPKWFLKEVFPNEQY